MEKTVREKCSKKDQEKLLALDNPSVIKFVAEVAKLCEPQSIFVKTDSKEDTDYIRKRALECKEEFALRIKGHTVHFDGMYDQARDKKATRYLLDEGENLGRNINSMPRQEGLKEIRGFLKGSMRNKEMIVCFFGLGPLNSEFFIPCIQITDSFYVAHSESILYRSSYEAFKRLSPKDTFFRFIHSAGELENGVSKHIDKRRIYIDLKENTVLSVNTQYAGNTVGLKKLALRLAIKKASREGWLAEHMFIMGVKKSGEITYFCGAYPSACGKTSTAMLEGETIIGDDIAYLRNIDGELRAVNVECGIFGIIRDVNAKTDPIIWEALTTEGEVIFSNVLVSEEGVPFWLGDKRVHPTRGRNFSGEWYEGKIDDMGNEIPPAHKNARYTINLKRLKNCDSHLDDHKGVKVGAIIYGGRDSDTSVPVQEAFDWAHGVITMGASLESETTAATLGKEGIRTFNLMSNLDFLSIPIEEYITNYIKFGERLKVLPLVFGVNYFLRDKNGVYLSAIEDKRIWLKWMSERVHKRVGAIKTPTGLIPKYTDLKRLFREYLSKDYTKDHYCKQFMLRIPENIAKIERIVNIYRENVPQVPQILFDILEAQKERLISLQSKYGDYIEPLFLEGLSK